MNKTISFVVPAKNAESTIIRCIESIINIKSIEKEIIIICNNCIDNTENKITEYIKNFPYIKLYICNSICNASEARNYGIKKSSSEWIMFVDSDDYFDETFSDDYNFNDILSLKFHLITNNYKMIKNNNISTKNHNIEHTGNYNQLDAIKYLKDFCYVPYKYTLFVHCWAKIYQRKIILNNNIYFDARLKQLEDVNFNLKYLNHTNTIYHTGLPIYTYDAESNLNGMSINSGNEENSVKKIYYALFPLKELLLKFLTSKEVKILFSQVITSVARIWIIRLSVNSSLFKKSSIIKINEIINSKIYKNCEKLYLCKENDSIILNVISKYLPLKAVLIYSYIRMIRR